MKLHSDNHENDDERNDDGLPPEFALLGEQLRDDAARLSACYPPSTAALSIVPDSVSPGAPPAVRTMWRSRRIVAALLIAGSAATIYSVQKQPAGGDLGEFRPALAVAATSHVGNEMSPAHGLDASAIDATLLFDESGFESLSRPAQEAVLDLFEDDVLPQGKLSI